LDTDLKTAILQLYERLHAYGILHGDVQLRHICFHENRPRLIDFEAASYVGPGNPGLNEEMDKVLALLQLA